jgi:hypothetical protein
MQREQDTFGRQRTPRRPSSIKPWAAPERNLDWIAALVGHG